MDGASPSPPAEEAGRQSLAALFFVFAKLGITSFGGGVSGMMHAELVVRRRWMREDEFLEGLAVSQALPGVNVANLAIWLGYRARGAGGALIALAAVILPPAVLIVLIGETLLRLSAWPVAGALLAGVAATAMGLSLAVGYRAARHAGGDLASVAILAGTIVGALVFHLSTPVLIAVFAPIGIGLAFGRSRREQG
ncbi:chromate transporter [Labrys wisconsinensis]|uniref:Chromate transporter n=1 Tax=Labrys wisconsinensis TaxID=425677 RepID=A0ABU0J5N7_9HYPH|nr:chromate transporter [Labrys wisconsinensis]MDQ0468960.1 chromate transporter [Labrys wisconsinensis]